jgi:hypothetical protein
MSSGKTTMWRAGQVRCLDGRIARAYVAKKPLYCACCLEVIPQGSTLTLHGTRRWRRPGPGGNAPRPTCWSCQPFELLTPAAARRLAFGAVG